MPCLDIHRDSAAIYFSALVLNEPPRALRFAH
jgi:hypothetical protein